MTKAACGPLFFARPMLFRTTAHCVNCRQGMTLGFWQLLPDPFRFQVKATCSRCGHTNRMPWYLSIGLLTVCLPMSMFVMLVTGGLLMRHGLWPPPSGWRTLVGAAFATVVVAVIAALFVRLWFVVARQPFVVPRDRRQGKR